jgi:hypothetical protein
MPCYRRDLLLLSVRIVEVPLGIDAACSGTTFFDDGWTSSSFMMKYWRRRYWCRISRHGGRSLRGSLGEFAGNLEPSRANFEETGVRNKHGNEDVGCLDLHVHVGRSVNSHGRNPALFARRAFS